MPGLVEDTVTNRRPVLPATGISYYSLPTGLGLHFIMMQMSRLSLAGTDHVTRVLASYWSIIPTCSFWLAAESNSDEASDEIIINSLWQKIIYESVWLSDKQQMISNIARRYILLKPRILTKISSREKWKIRFKLLWICKSPINRIYPRQFSGAFNNPKLWWNFIIL